MARKKKTNRPIETYEYKDKQRLNNPPVGLVTPQTDPDAEQKKRFAYDPHLDPQMVWACKAEHTSIEVPTVSLHQNQRSENKAQWQVEVYGFDYYNTKTDHIESGSADKIAVWMLDTDYDGRSLYPRQVFFPMDGSKGGWARLARNLKAEIDEELVEAYRGTVPLPLELGEHGRVAVKIVDDRGIESLKVLGVN